MKQQLTVQESAYLIKRGVRRNRMNLNFEPIFNIADLLEILPKEMYGEETDYCDCKLHILSNELGWTAAYIAICGSEIVTMKFTSYGKDLIDALFALMCKLLDNHVKLD